MIPSITVSNMALQLKGVWFLLDYILCRIRRVDYVGGLDGTGRDGMGWDGTAGDRERWHYFYIVIIIGARGTW